MEVAVYMAVFFLEMSEIYGAGRIAFGSFENDWWGTGKKNALSGILVDLRVCVSCGTGSRSPCARGCHNPCGGGGGFDRVLIGPD